MRCSSPPVLPTGGMCTSHSEEECNEQCWRSVCTLQNRRTGQLSSQQRRIKMLGVLPRILLTIKESRETPDAQNKTLLSLLIVTKTFEGAPNVEFYQRSSTQPQVQRKPGTQGKPQRCSGPSAGTRKHLPKEEQRETNDQM